MLRDQIKANGCEGTLIIMVSWICSLFLQEVGRSWEKRGGKKAETET